MQIDKRILLRDTIIILLSAGLLSACYGGKVRSVSEVEVTSTWQGGSDVPESAYPMGTDELQVVYPVDAIFNDFYNTLGGQEVLGPAISPVSREGALQFQYVENALMVYDENASTSDRFRLGSLGLEFGIAEKPVPDPRQPDNRYVGGHLILQEFITTYDALGGARYVGEPITEARFNPAKARTEQYFENLGFYRLEQEKPGLIRLMAYGAYACDFRCRYQTPFSSIPERQPILPDQFQYQANLLGLDFTGRALTGVHLAADQTEEVIFENLVLYKDPTKSGKVVVRPIVEMLGFIAHEPVWSDPNPLMIFSETQGGKGYNVPLLFEDYIQRHGGRNISGPPLSEAFPTKYGAFRQCFTNLCLDYDLNAASGERLRLALLGARYKEEIFDKAIDFKESLSVKNVNLLLWEKFMRLSSGEPQEIYVSVSENGVALTNREPILILSYPSGETQTFYFPPTGEDGVSSIGIPGIKAPNGTLIAYKVCLLGFGEESQCVGENYLIWNSE